MKREIRLTSFLSNGLVKNLAVAAFMLEPTTLAGCASRHSGSSADVAAFFPAANPFLADSFYPIGHTNSAQVDSTPVPGPAVPGHRLAAGEIETQTTGPGHLAGITSSKYANGQRVIWTNSQYDIVKMDYDTLRVLATFKLDNRAQFTDADADRIATGLKAGGLIDRLKSAGDVMRKGMPTDLASVYTMVDRDQRYIVGSTRGLAAYGDSVAGDANSEIVKKQTWSMPDEIPGKVVGINMTYDGWIVLATDAGAMVTLSRDFSRYHSVMLPHSDEAPAYNARMDAEHRTGYGWIRNSIAGDEKGGIYVAADRWMEKAVWDGRQLSVDPASGAWAAPYSDTKGYGTGATPALMGFGDGDRLVVITDGDTLMQVTAFWRDEIPAGWTAPKGALSNRTAGVMPVKMGDPNRQALQSEQAVVVAGYGALVVNNEPASIPRGLPRVAQTLLISLLADDPAYTPFGMEKFAWDTAKHILTEAWTNTQVSSPNCVPYASIGSNMAYTVGAKNGEWVLEAVRLDTGALSAEYQLGGARFNTNFSGITVDSAGRILYGGLFGAVRLDPKS
jgi:hypothetical protein